MDCVEGDVSTVVGTDWRHYAIHRMGEAVNSNCFFPLLDNVGTFMN